MFILFKTYKGIKPVIHKTAYIAKTAEIIGDVKIDEDVSIWPQTVIRGDVAPVTIGKRTNIQDLSLIHQSIGIPVVIEDDVSIGHQVTLHSCLIKKNALVGMGSIILDGAEIGENSFIGAGSLVTPRTVIPPNTLAFGSPAKVVRTLTDEDLSDMERTRKTYVERGAYYKKNNL